MRKGELAQCAECGCEMIRQSYRHKLCRKCGPEVARRTSLEKMESINRARYTIYLRDEFKCVYCGASSIENGALLVLDHVVPYCDGGGSDLYNLVTCCDSCNTTKGPGRLPREIYLRIVERNKIRNGGISPKTQQKVNDVLEKYFSITKAGGRI
jgi:5-methylcytosine-specific restriction endonuclease McrA